MKPKEVELEKDGNVISVLDSNGKIQPRYMKYFSQEEFEIISNYLRNNPPIPYTK